LDKKKARIYLAGLDELYFTAVMKLKRIDMQRLGFFRKSQKPLVSHMIPATIKTVIVEAIATMIPTHSPRSIPLKNPTMIPVSIPVTCGIIWSHIIKNSSAKQGL